MIWYYMEPSVEGTKDLPLYLFSLGLHELQPRIDRPSGYPYDQFFYNSCGTGWLELDGKKYELPEGSAFFVPAHMPHSYYPDGDVWDVRWMAAGGEALQDILKKFNMDKGGAYPLNDESELDKILNHMRVKVITNQKYGSMLASGYVYQFILEFVYQTSLYQNAKKEAQPYEQEMMLLKEYVDIHYMYPISLNDLCKIVPVSHQYLCRIFKQNTNMRPMEYVSGVRVEKAKSLLIYSDYSVKEIAEKCGFRNTNYFNVTFRKWENMTPIEFRNSVL